MQKGDKYVFKEGVNTCVIVKTTKTTVTFRITLATFDLTTSKKEFLKYWQPYIIKEETQ